MKTGLLLPALLLATACSPKAVWVDKAWIRLPAVPGQPGAAYFVVHGASGRDETLVGLSTPSAAKSEMHESMTGDRGMMAMAPLREFVIPASRDVAFAPGGKHVMLYSIKPDVKPGSTVKLTLLFMGGKIATTDAKVVGAGADAPE